MTWDDGQPHFKEPLARKVRTGLRRKKHVAAEQDVMRAVRKEDGYCRFPKCGCKKYQLRQDVCHDRHRGMGGNPKLDRTEPGGLILLCAARHRENRVALDRGTLRIRALTDAGWRGPCEFAVDARMLDVRADPEWIVVGTEHCRHGFEPFTVEQIDILDKLAEMCI